MARISTYPLVLPTAEDHVIGTDAEAQNATRVFSVGELARFIRTGYSQVVRQNITFGEDIDTEIDDTLPDRYLNTVDAAGNITIPAVTPIFTVTHNLNSLDVIVRAFDRVTAANLMDPNNFLNEPVAPLPDGTTPFTPSTGPAPAAYAVTTGALTEYEDAIVTLVDENTVTVDMGPARPINGVITVVG